MFKNYVIIAFRNIRRNFGYAFLNVFGLTLGIASCLILFLVVRNELTYDNYAKADRICRVTLNAIDFNSNVSLAVAPKMRNDFPELEQVSQVMYNNSAIIKINSQRFKENDVAFADQYLPQIFDFQWISGNPKTALAEPNSIVLTESVAKKYYGNDNPMGQVINIENQFNAKVTGVIKDQPGNRSVPIRILISLETIKERVKQGMGNFWNIGGGYFTFILLPQNYPVQRIQARIPAFLHKNWDLNPKEVRLPIQPIKNIHFDQRYINNVITPTSKDTYYALFGVALLIVITACINFVNLATAQAIKRAKEVGVRKVLGATRPQLIKQFLGETAILVFLALVAGVILAYTFLSGANNWIGINIDPHQLLQPMVIGYIFGVTLLVILIAGLYPAFVQSAFQPVDSLKDKAGKFVKGFSLRKSLVLAQFAISQIMIVGTLVVAGQMNYFKNQDLGFKKDAVISFYIPDNKKADVLRHELASNPGIDQVTFSNGAPSYNNAFNSFTAPEFGITKDGITELKFVDENYIDLFGMKMLAGQKVFKKSPQDSAITVVANETMIHEMNIIDPNKAVGKQIFFDKTPATIIGVVQDFQSESKHKKRRACVLSYIPNGFFMASIKMRPGSINKTIAQVGKTWNTMFPDNLFDYQFLDEHIAKFYTQEQKVYTAFQLFSSIAIIIGCLGLYGLIMFAAAQRTKEVGIRKVLGAPVVSIIALFSREFVILIGIAFLIAAPLGYWIMNTWLSNYAYHISINAGLFIIAITASFAIAAITIAYQTIKAALINPVKSLRSE
ncbi:ABC transporter permease [Mucilaginibacter sp.]|jgi:ABC-type antimicrobial peptide transport system permease subunit|uniref:ABC transporter permease n=1 Tax=Mucilaginibacter sp. TaxID=1882438 RepID=UPI002CA01ECF|nr:FtsX-like permease family protein [Mucilaginibacter sp.]HTI61830.1 FtsX-like permease family protein [Mucilaginibacter sp.]